MSLSVELVSPERVAYSGEAEMVVCRTTAGDIAFQTGHVPFIGVLQTHKVKVIAEGGAETVIAVHQGFVEVSPVDPDGNTRVTILSDVAELADTVATWATSLLSFTGVEISLSLATMASVAFRMPRCREVGLAPAVTLRRPSE